MYNNPYFSNFNMQQNLDNINNNIAELEKLKSQIQNRQPVQPITQNFQLAPSNQGGIKYVNSVEDVNKETVMMDTPFFSKDLTVVWIKNSKGEIKSYELNEITLKDEKDIMIENLQNQINELKGMINNEHDTNTNATVESEKPTNVQVHRTSTKKQQ